MQWCLASLRRRQKPNSNDVCKSKAETASPGHTGAGGEGFCWERRDTFLAAEQAYSRAFAMIDRRFSWVVKGGRSSYRPSLLLWVEWRTLPLSPQHPSVPGTQTLLPAIYDSQDARKWRSRRNHRYWPVSPSCLVASLRYFRAPRTSPRGCSSLLHSLQATASPQHWSHSRWWIAPGCQREGLSVVSSAQPKAPIQSDG